MDSSYEEDQYIEINSSTDDNCKSVTACQLQYGDYFILSESEVIQVDSVRKNNKARSQKNEMNIQGRNLMNNSIFVQYKFPLSRNLRVIKDAQIRDYRIVAFEPEEDLIYVHGNGGVQELNISKKREEFEVVSPNISRVIARCLHYDGELQLLGFYADTTKQQQQQ